MRLQRQRWAEARRGSIHRARLSGAAPRVPPPFFAAILPPLPLPLLPVLPYHHLFPLLLAFVPLDPLSHLQLSHLPSSALADAALSEYSRLCRAHLAAQLLHSLRRRGRVRPSLQAANAVLSALARSPFTSPQASLDAFCSLIGHRLPRQVLRPRGAAQPARRPGPGRRPPPPGGLPLPPAADQSEAAATPPLGTKAACDIRHVAKDRDADLHRVARAGRTKFKRASSSSTTSKPTSGKRASPRPATPTREQEPLLVAAGSGDERDDARAPSLHLDREESAGSHHHPDAAASEDTEVEAASHVSQAAEEHHSHEDQEEEEEVGLELTLGLEPLVVRQPRSPTCDLRGLSAASSLMGLRLELPA